MEYILMFFMCGHSSGGGVYCEWKSALVFKRQYECNQVLQDGKNWDGTVRLGHGYVLARCVKSPPKVEK